MSCPDTKRCEAAADLLRNQRLATWGLVPIKEVLPARHCDDEPSKRGADVDERLWAGGGDWGWGGLHLHFEAQPDGADERETLRLLDGRAAYRADSPAALQMLYMAQAVAELRDEDPTRMVHWPVWRLPPLRRTGKPPRPRPVTASLLGHLVRVTLTAGTDGVENPDRVALERLERLLGGEEVKPIYTSQNWIPTTRANFEAGLAALGRALEPCDDSVASDTQGLKKRLLEALGPVYSWTLPAAPAALSPPEARARRPRVLNLFVGHPDLDGLPRDNRFLLAGDLLCAIGAETPPTKSDPDRDLKLADRMRKAWRSLSSS
jgi:hypothetical protein